MHVQPPLCLAFILLQVQLFIALPFTKGVSFEAVVQLKRELGDENMVGQAQTWLDKRSAVE